MKFIDTVYEKLARHPKRIVFPEGAEPRTQHAAAEFAARKLGAPILLGHRDTIESVAKGEGLDLHKHKIAIIDPANSVELPTFCERLENWTVTNASASMIPGTSWSTRIISRP